MKKELFLKYLNLLLKEYTVTFRFALKGAKEKHIHDLRILIKRLNALFFFLDKAGIYEKKSHSYFNQLKKFFKSAGNLRDIQVQRLLVKDYRKQIKADLIDYETYLAYREDDAKSEFFRLSANYPYREQMLIKKEIISLIKAFEQDKLTSQANTFMMECLDLIEKYLFHRNTRKYLHKIRQILKQLRYFIEIYQFCSEPDLFSEADLTEVKEIENVLGKWNDRAVLTGDLRRYKFITKKLDTGLSNNEIIELIKMISAEMKKMISDVRPRLLKLTYHLKYLML